MARPLKDEAYDVSDSTDWLQTPLPSLAPVDSALRCQVCRDFYNTPMITSCSHTFCSLCIRHCLNNDAKCPTCRKGDQESKLRNNYVLEELVEAYKSARPNIMEYTKKREEVRLKSSPKRKRTEAEVEDGSSPVHKRTRAGRRAQRSSQPAEIIDSDGDDEDFLPGIVRLIFR
jgi:E3 ubiquitin-protein ligase RAD18